MFIWLDQCQIKVGKQIEKKRVISYSSDSSVDCSNPYFEDAEMHGLSEISCHAQIPPNVSSYRGALDASLAAEKFGVAPALLAQVATVEVVWVAKRGS